jgi:hypothetical protein
MADFADTANEYPTLRMIDRAAAILWPRYVNEGMHCLVGQKPGIYTAGIV